MEPILFLTPDSEIINHPPSPTTKSENYTNYEYNMGLKVVQYEQNPGMSTGQSVRIQQQFLCTNLQYAGEFIH